MKVIVTGGASGLGAAIVRELGQKGHEVWFTYCKNENLAQRLLTEFPRMRASYCDFTQSDSLLRFCAEVASTQVVDGLVNNALPGLIHKHFQKTEVASWVSGFSRQVTPVLQITQAALTPMRKNRSGQICTVLTSYLFERPPVGLSAYIAEKAYLEAMSRSWAAENATFGIASNCISPSFMDTPLNAGTDERVLEAMREQLLPKRLLTVEEVASAIRVLLEGPASVTATHLLMNGGSSAV